jgi:hypothetical protein
MCMPPGYLHHKTRLSGPHLLAALHFAKDMVELLSTIGTDLRRNYEKCDATSTFDFASSVPANTK